jgi:hypothetical protein
MPDAHRIALNCEAATLGKYPVLFSQLPFGRVPDPAEASMRERPCARTHAKAVTECRGIAIQDAAISRRHRAMSEANPRRERREAYRVLSSGAAIDYFRSLSVTDFPPFSYRTYSNVPTNRSIEKNNDCRIAGAARGQKVQTARTKCPARA